MRKLDEKREVLYVIRAMDVLMSSGIGLEATVHSVSQGGYGVISEDFAKMMENVRKGGRPLEKELKSLMKNVETEGYRRLLNIMHMNITQNNQQGQEQNHFLPLEFTFCQTITSRCGNQSRQKSLPDGNQQRIGQNLPKW